MAKTKCLKSLNQFCLCWQRDILSGVTENGRFGVVRDVKQNVVELNRGGDAEGFEEAIQYMRLDDEHIGV